MPIFLSNRDGDGKTNEEGHYRLLSKTLSGQVLQESGLVTSPTNPTALAVSISEGDFKIPSGSGYDYMGWIEVNEVVSISQNTTSNNRISSVVLYVDMQEDSGPIPPNNLGVVKAVSVDGASGSSPQPPNDTTIRSSIGQGNPFIKISDILVRPNVTQIIDNDITDQRQFVELSTELTERQSFIESMGDIFYPVGTIYQNALDDRNPAVILGFGTWQRHAPGRHIIGQSTTGLYSSLGENGGQLNHTLSIAQMPRHTHTGRTSNSGNHQHTYYNSAWAQLSPHGTNTNRVAWEGVVEQGRVTSASGNHNHTFTTAATGNGASFSPMTPYNVSARWMRIA